MQEIWPKTFGLSMMNRMSKFLIDMLLSETEGQWEKCYNDALTFIEPGKKKR